MFKYNKITIFLLLSNLLLLLNACNPNSSQITIYTTDIDEVKKGEIVDIPMKLSFQMIGEDEDNSLEKSKNIAIKFLHPDSKFYITKGQYTKDFVVETFIPMLKAIFGYIDLIFLNCFIFLTSCCLVKHVIIPYSDNFSAIPSSPTPSILAAIIGIPDHSLLLYLNL